MPFRDLINQHNNKVALNEEEERYRTHAEGTVITESDQTVTIQIAGGIITAVNQSNGSLGIGSIVTVNYGPDGFNTARGKSTI